MKTITVTVQQVKDLLVEKGQMSPEDNLVFKDLPMTISDNDITVEITQEKV